MTSLPPISDFTDSSRTEGQVKTFMTDVRSFLSSLLGTDGTVATALSTLGASLNSYSPKTSAYTVVSSDRGRGIVATSGTWTLSLSAVASLGAGFSFWFWNQGTGTITIDPSGTEQVDGATTVSIPPGRGGVLFNTGSSWISSGIMGTAGGPLRSIAGSATAPSIGRGDDSDSGIYFPAPDQIGMSTAATLRALLSSTAFQIDVPVTGTSAQSSTTDATSGRLLKTGAFGLGANNVAVPDTPASDMDAQRVSGLWRHLAAYTGSPGYSGSYVHLVRGTGNGVGFHMQIAVGVAGQVSARAMSDASGTWLPWNHFQTQGATHFFANGNLITGDALTIADDAVGSFSPGKRGGLLLVVTAGLSTTPLNTYSALVFFDVGSTLYIEKLAATATFGNLVNVGTSALSGTTGADVALNLAVQADVIQLENRTGASRTFTVLAL